MTINFFKVLRIIFENQLSPNLIFSGVGGGLREGAAPPRRLEGFRREVLESSFGSGAKNVRNSGNEKAHRRCLSTSGQGQARTTSSGKNKKANLKFFDFQDLNRVSHLNFKPFI
jgi:hypothetical protein